MFATPILLLEKDEPNTNIEWWNVNRRKLNEVIHAFNQWQINGFSTHGRAVVEAMVERCEKYGEENDFHQRQFDTLAQIRKHLQDTVDVEPRETTSVSYSVPSDFFSRLEDLGAKWMSEDGRCELQALIDEVRM